MGKIFFSVILFFILQLINGLICLISIYLFNLGGDAFKLIALSQGFTNQILIILGFVFVDRLTQSKISENDIAFVKEFNELCIDIGYAQKSFHKNIIKIINDDSELELSKYFKSLLHNTSLSLSTPLRICLIDNLHTLSLVQTLKIKKIIKVAEEISRSQVMMYTQVEKLKEIRNNHRMGIINNLKLMNCHLLKNINRFEHISSKILLKF